MADDFLEFPEYPDEETPVAKPRAFVRAGRVADVKPGRARSLLVGSTRIAVWRVGDRLFACRDRCPHMGADLSMGRLDGGRVVCAWHGWTFDLSTGACATRAWAAVEVFAVRIVGEDFEVEVPIG